MESKGKVSLIQCSLPHSNHARFFYSKLLHFRRSTPPVPPTVTSSTTLDEMTDDSTELCGPVNPSISPSHFPSPPPFLTPTFADFDYWNPRCEIEEATPSKWDSSLNTPQASLLSDEILKSLAHSHSEQGHIRHSAPPQPHLLPSDLLCLHEFGPIASAPPQIESFPFDPLPNSPRLVEDPPRKNSAATIETNKPFLDLGQSDSASLRSDYSYGVLNRSSLDSTRSNIDHSERIPLKKPSMHQRIRSLLSAPSAPRPGPLSVPLPVSPRVSTTQALRNRPSSPTPSTATTSSRLTRSNAYRSLGRALLGKDPKSPVLESSFPPPSEISYAQRIVLKTLSPSTASPVPSSTFSLNSRRKEKIGDDLRFLASTTSSSSPALLSLPTPTEGTKTIRKSTMKKKLSSRMLEFFHDTDDATPSSPASTPTATTVKLTKEKRRPQALSLASSNLLAVNAKIEPRPPSLVKKLSSFGIGSSRSSQLPLPLPSPLILNSPTPTSLSFDKKDIDPRSSIVSSLHSPPLRSPQHSVKRPLSEPLTFPVHPNLSTHRRSTLSTTLSPLASHWSPDTSTSSTTSSQLSTVQAENAKLLLENKLLRSTLESKEEELKLLKRREETTRRLIEDALTGQATMRKEESKTSLADEESVEGTEEEWVKSLKRLERGIFAE